MKYSHPNLFTNEIKNANSLRNKEINRLNRNTEKKEPKENAKQNSLSKDELNYYKNKNKKNKIIHIEPIKSATIPSKKKILNNNNILSEENLISLMNKYINFSLNKNPNNKKKKLIRNNYTNLNEEKKDNIENNKKICMESLIKKGIITEIKDLQKPKKETLKEKLAQKKKSFLEDIGIEPSNITSFQESTNDNNNNNNYNKNNVETNDNNNKINYDENKDINNNYYKTFTGICSSNKRIKYFSSKHNYDLYLYDDDSFTDKECKKTPLKPKINQFEYILKIKKERSKIQTNPNYMSVEPEKPSKKLKFIKILTPKIENTINDSFRRKNKKLNKKINYTNYNINRIKNFNNNKINLNNNKNDEYLYSHKKNYRSPDELNKYIKNKKEKDKENEEKRITKKNKDLFIKYKNLCTLNNNYYKKNNSPKYYNTISMRSKTHTSGFNFEDKKRDNKIKLSENIRDNNSTLIDANEYYLNILESKKLIIKNLYSKTETQFYNSKNNNHEKLKNIENFFNNKNNENNNIYVNNKDNNKKEMIRKISKKINDTLIKAKKIFSLEENNDKNSFTENNKDNNIVNNDNNNNGKEQIKEKDIIIKSEKIMKIENKEPKEIIKKEAKIENIINEENKEIIKNISNKEQKESKGNEDIKEIIKKDVNKIDDEIIKINNNKDSKRKDENIIKDNQNIKTGENKEIIKFEINKEIKVGKENKNIENNIINIKKDENQINSKENDNINSINNYLKEEKGNLKEQKINSKSLHYFTNIIKKYLRKNIFSNLYNYYLKIVVLEHYFTSISYFIAFCKKYPFIKLREHFYKSKVFTSLKELINPFIKKNLLYFFDELKKNKNKIKNNCIGINSENNKNKKDEDLLNGENKVNKKIIENNVIMENLIEESPEDKNNNNISDFYSNTLNSIYNNKNNKIRNENNNKEFNIVDDKENNKSEQNFIDNENNIENKENKSSNREFINNKKDNDENNNNNIFKDIIISDENISRDKNDILLIQNNNKNEKSRNEILLNNENEDNNNEEYSNKLKNIKLEFDNIDIDKLTKEILDKILLSEISSKEAIIIPKKKFKFEIKLKKNRSNLSSNSANNSTDNLIKDIFDISGLSNLSLNDDNLSSLNDSIMSSYTEKSFFNKTIIEKKKYNLLYFYQKYIAPKLIKLIRKEIINKYERIYENISKPYINNSDKIMMSLILQDADMLRNNFKCQNNGETISEIIDKDNLLKKFEIINKKIRNYWKINENKKNKKNEIEKYDEYIEYDENMNKCLIDCCIELINCERKYGENGNPLIWSSRIREIKFKYEKNNPYKLADFVCRNLFKYLKRKVGLICDNYENMPSEQMNLEREKRLNNIVRNELDEGDYLWKNLEMEETQLKVEVTDNIMDQLYNEIIEILEHIQLNRNKSELYHNKSIYACEEMPKLSFQQTTTENVEVDDAEEDLI